MVGNRRVINVQKIRQCSIHYARKEQLFFTFLEKYGFAGPSKVMWGKHNEIRDLIKSAILNIEKEEKKEDLKPYINEYMNPLVEEFEGMIFQEGNILFSAAR